MAETGPLIAALDKHSQVVAGPQGQSANRGHYGVRRQAEARTLRLCCDTEDRLGQAEGRAGADAGADAERDIGVPDA